MKATPLDVVENPKSCVLLSWMPRQLARSLDDLDASAINTDFCHLCSLNPKKARLHWSALTALRQYLGSARS